jgi:hypothetical protein
MIVTTTQISEESSVSRKIYQKVDKLWEKKYKQQVVHAAILSEV